MSNIVECPICKTQRSVSDVQLKRMNLSGNFRCKQCAMKEYAKRTGDKIQQSDKCIIIAPVCDEKRNNGYLCIVECPNCKKHFKKSRGDIRKDNHTVCKTCKNKESRKHIESTDDIIIVKQFSGNGYYATVECPMCHVIYERQRGEINRINHTYCNKCNRSGSRHWRWSGGGARYYGKDWATISDKIRERDNNSCVICKKKNNGYRKIDVHHIIRFFDFKYLTEANSYSNLASLCVAHHRWADAYPDKSIPLLKSLLPSPITTE